MDCMQLILPIPLGKVVLEHKVFMCASALIGVFR